MDIRQPAVIIPAMDTNRYDPKGDLANFGTVSLLEWKLGQMKKVVDPERIYVASPSKQILTIAKRSGVQGIKRSTADSPIAIVGKIVQQVDYPTILWTHTTSPFIDPSEYKKMIKKYFLLKGLHDTLVAVYAIKEYIMYNNKALNFGTGITVSRKNIKPIYKITNGCFIASKQVWLKTQNFIGQNPYLYNLSRLAAMEINDIDEYTIANNLISIYFKREVSRI